MRQANPADATNLPSVSEQARIPMSVPVANLGVQEIPGFHLHWFRGDPQRIARALQGGYQFVEKDEVTLNDRSIGNSPIEGGDTDLGTRVSRIAGAELGTDNQPVRMYLMKIKEELWQQDQAALTAPGSRIDGVRRSLIEGFDTDGKDRAQLYVDQKRTKIPDFLKQKTRTTPVQS